MISFKIARTFKITSLVLLVTLLIGIQPVKGQSPIVHAILFYSPSCTHCHKVMTEDLPPLKAKFGIQLDILEVDTTTQEGSNLYQAAVEQFKIPEERLGVPTMIIGDTVLVGEKEIPDQLPGIVEVSANGSGIDWPKIPGLQSIVDKRSTVQSSSPILARIQRDLAGNSLSIIVLIGMVLSLVYNFWNFTKASRHKTGKKAKTLTELKPQWIIPLLIVIGIGVSAYLTFVEITHTEAVCGPVGNCTDVQSSPYAKLFGILSVGTFGLIGYGFVSVTWLLSVFGNQEWRDKAYLAMWAMIVFGTLFSLYLTFLEPFVIGATCLWCLSSAIIMTVLFWISTPKAALAFNLMNVKPPRKRH
jgi:uncharacterized membrane protein